MRTLTGMILLFTSAAAFAACGDDSTPSPTPTPQPRTPSAVATRTPGTATAQPPATPSTAAQTPRAPAATATLAPDRRFELAPIDGAEMVVRESVPPQYAVHITSGLPSGCAEFADAIASRAGDQVTITVRNTMPADPQVACTQIYGTHETVVELGSDFAAGRRYTVRVNDRTLDFTAR